MSQKSRLFLYILITAVLFFGNIWAEENVPTEKLQIENADKVNGQTLNGKRITVFSGNVIFKQGVARLYCNKAFQYIDEDYTVLFGDVHLIDESKEMFGDKITYYQETKYAIAQGDVKLIDSTKTIFADFLKYYKLEDKVIADSNVSLFDNHENITLVGSHVEYLRETGYAIVIGDPVFTRLDTTNNTLLTITGKKIEMFNDGDTVRVEDDVHITRGDMLATCGTLTYIKTDEEIILNDSPFAMQNESRLTGKTLIMYLRENKVYQVDITGSAIVTTKVDSLIKTAIPYDLLTGEKITASIREEKIDSVRISGRATSYYHVIDDNQEQGLSKVLCDELLIVFGDDQVKWVKGKSNPGISNGIFYPPKNKAKIEQELSALLEKLKINYLDIVPINVSDKLRPGE